MTSPAATRRPAAQEALETAAPPATNPSRPRVLLMCQDTIGESMAGPAIRYYTFARELSRSCDITLLLGQPIRGHVDLDGINVVSLNVIGYRTVRNLARKHDVVLTQPQRVQLQQALFASGTPVVYDLYAPLVVEQLASKSRPDSLLPGIKASANAQAQRSLWIRRAQIEEDAALRSGSAFICASETQRTFWLGALARAGRLGAAGYAADPSFTKLLSIVPFGIDNTPLPTSSTDIRARMGGATTDDLLLLWAGGIWDWLDPLVVIRAMPNVLAKNPHVRLHFMATQHPNADVRMTMTQRAVDLARELKLLDAGVSFNEQWVPYAKRAQYLAAADVGVCAHFDSLETRLAYRQRVVDHVWAGLPTLTTAGGVLSEMVEQSGGGAVIAPGDVDGWTRSILALAQDRARLHEMATSVKSLAPELGWRRICAQLEQVLAHAASLRTTRARQRHPTGDARSPLPLLPAYVAVQARLQGVRSAAAKVVRSVVS